MARKLLSSRGGITTVALFLSCGRRADLDRQYPNCQRHGDRAGGQWDEKASKELAAALHNMHEVANAGDMKALKNVLMGDDALVTFELNADNMTPVPLRSKKEIDAFVDRVNGAADAQQGEFTLDMPIMNCRATATFGVCTEECTVRFKAADGTERIDKLYGTATGVKTADGWKWVQWHMSVANEPQTVKNGKVASASANHNH